MSPAGCASSTPAPAMEDRHYLLFNEVQDSHWWFQARNRIMRTLLAEHLCDRQTRSRPAGLALLDVGCGTGAMLPMLREFGAVTGVEISSQAVTLCRQRGHHRVFLDSDPAWQQTRYDVLTFFDVLEHVDDDAATLAHYLRWLQPHGLVVITVPAFMWLWSEHDEINQHRRRYNKTHLRRLLQVTRLQPFRLSYYNSLLFLPIAGLRLLQKALPARRQPPRSDFEKLCSANRCLEAIFAAERFWLRRHSAPLGLSLLCLAKRGEPAEAGNTHPDGINSRIRSHAGGCGGARSGL
ncbi:MAG: class I SAM-dependent methyltransferase [candidate division KSB1 bacterium]|nr:class I SAM-dependent methyltransferase [candidate division KSB1 bacterium]MDZ7288145.1 class I SAM-dependent methyltransferase [candidate division KSB1 bacterium]MDZ7300342.1 class I SAM-dependent methyltransferase [candidate division KSB1 bacterium]MDZ7306155.1 class I SAM-dependent methyltransferase [candidate division KSB1 bacterium]MDZ7351342.1 class I SAM-dependent methyltransferase [candidate division KSB1 bacterium]